MKDIEINSDKSTFFTLCFFVALALLGLVSDVYKLLTHHVSSYRDSGITSYLVPGLTIYMAVTVCLDRQIRKEYPFAVAGGCGIGLGSLLMIAVRWLTAAPAKRHLADTFLIVLNSVSTGLLLFEAVRWFRKTVRLSL